MIISVDVEKAFENFGIYNVHHKMSQQIKKKRELLQIEKAPFGQGHEVSVGSPRPGTGEMGSVQMV